MEEEKSLEQQALELGMVLGERRAFGMVAGRCSAAQAECMRKLRDGKLYLKFAPNWGEYCERHLKTSKSTADRNIALLKKHGTLYFEVAAITGISPAEFERIAPHIQSDGIHAGSEIIALIPANAERAVEAVARLQSEAVPVENPKPPASAEKQILDLEKNAERLCASFHETAAACHGDNLRRLFAAIHNVQHMFKRLELEIK